MVEARNTARAVQLYAAVGSRFSPPPTHKRFIHNTNHGGGSASPSPAGALVAPFLPASPVPSPRLIVVPWPFAAEPVCSQQQRTAVLLSRKIVSASVLETEEVGRGGSRWYGRGKRVGGHGDDTSHPPLALPKGRAQLIGCRRALRSKNDIVRPTDYTDKNTSKMSEPRPVIGRREVNSTTNHRLGSVINILTCLEV